MVETKTCAVTHFEDILKLVDQEFEAAQRAVAEIGPVYERAHQRLVRAQVVRDFLKNLVVPTDSGPVKPRKLLAEVVIERQKVDQPELPLPEADSE